MAGIPQFTRTCDGGEVDGCEHDEVGRHVGHDLGARVALGPRSDLALLQVVREQVVCRNGQGSDTFSFSFA